MNHRRHRPSTPIWTGSPQRVKAGPLLFAVIFIVAFGTGFILPSVRFLQTGEVPEWISLSINGIPLSSETSLEAVWSAMIIISAMLLMICLSATLYVFHKRSERYELFESTAMISWTFPFNGRRTVRLEDVREVKRVECFGLQSLCFRTGKAHLLKRIYRLDSTEFSNLRDADAAEQHLVSKMNESPNP